MHFKQLGQLTKDSFKLSTIVYAERTEQSVLDNLMHPGVQAGNSIKVEHYSQNPRYPFGFRGFFFCVVIEERHCSAERIDAGHSKGYTFIYTLTNSVLWRDLL